MATRRQKTHHSGKSSARAGTSTRSATRDRPHTRRTPSGQQDDEPQMAGPLGGQGMGQGRGMNAGEAHAVAAPDDDSDER
jgi:hypothetical protein